ncbi:MAG: DNA repair exonuclease [Clostridia bacterium]|nr:DNA repair exonuclease [Clostridia bacterium]
MRFLHIADLHLDAPFSTKDALTAKKLREDQLTAFRRAVGYCDENGIPLVLIAGDMFDSRYVSAATAFAACDVMRASKARFVISPGNHDPYNEGSVYGKIRFPENVAVFKKDSLARISLDDLNTAIYGFAFTGERMETSPLGGSFRADPRTVNILLCHGTLNDPSSEYCPLSVRDIVEAGVDYAALGHVHKGDAEPLSSGRCYYAYPGCFVGRSFDECGEKGGFVIDIEKSSGMLDLRYSFVRFSDTRYETAEVDVTGCLGDGEAAVKVNEYIERAGLSDAFLRAFLVGSVDPSVELSEGVIAKLIRAKSADVRDRTAPAYDFDALKGDLSLRGAFYRTLLPKLNSDDERERETAEKALRLGLEALAK